MSFKQLIVLSISIMLLLSCQDNKKQTEQLTPEAYWKSQIELYPDSALLKESLIQYYRDSGLYDKAIAFTDSILTDDTDNAKLWHIKGALEFENDDTIDAGDAFEKAYQLNPNPIDAIYMARIFAYHGNTFTLDFCNEIISRFGKDFEKETYLVKGIFYASTNNQEKALSCFDSSIRSSYTFMEAYLQKGLLQIKMNRYVEATETFKKATTVQNNYDEGFFYLGKCFENAKDTAAATDAYGRTLLINPDYIEAKEALQRLSK